MKKCSTIFMGTPSIAKTLLENMINAGIQIDLVVTQPDRKVGRKQKIVFSPVKECALEHSIEVFQPNKIKEDHQRILDLDPDLIVTCAYGQIVPDVILNAPKYGCVNLHGSLLPKYRGAAPIQRAIWNGDKESGMTLMKMVTEMDAGPIFDVEKIQIGYHETSTTLFEKMAQAASNLLIRDYDSLCSEDAQYKPQDPDQVTYADKISKEDEKIDLIKDDLSIYDQIRALSREPGGYIMIKNKKFKILYANYHKQEIEHPMTFIGKYEKGYGLTLHDGILEILECQMEGKPVVTGLDFANGQGQNLKNKTLEWDEEVKA